MLIALDATYSAADNLSGVGVYSREILHGLPRLPETCGTGWLWCYRPHRFARSFRSALPQRCRRRLLFDRFVPAAALFHGLNQRLPSSRLNRAVSTFHDLFVLTGDYSTPEFRSRFAQQARHAAARSDLIIAVSSFTASQVESLLNVERSRIRVVHHGVHPPAPSPSSPKEQLILSVGALQKRKNTAALVRAFEHCPASWKLVLAGSFGHGAEDALSLIENSPRRPDIEVTGYVDDAALEHLYARASLFAFPSLDEGFGMPVLEAMARGIPVLASNLSALPEVCGDAALLVDPSSVEAIHDGLRQLIDSESLRARLIQRGHARARQFTWDAAVGRTWDVYRELMPG
jgi:glycosyltransferase involved in cell wall biosynthesis